MTSYFSALKGSGPGIWWRSSLLFSCIIIGSVLYIESEYKYLSEGKLSESMPTFSSRASPKLNEQIKALQEKVDMLQKRCVLSLFVLILSMVCSTYHASKSLHSYSILSFGWSPSNPFGSIAGSIT